MQRKGFTLVEIMIVVAIIGILIAIAVPGFLRAREISRRNGCQENLTKIDGAIQQYILEFRLPGIEEFNAEVEDPEQGEVGDLTWLYGDPDADDAGVILFGEGAYVRFAPACPAGGLYGLTPPADLNPATGDFPVYCTLQNRGEDVSRAFWHVFPGTADDAVVTDRSGG